MAPVLNDDPPSDDPTNPAFFAGARGVVWFLFGGAASVFAFLGTAGIGMPWLGFIALPPFAVVMVDEAVRAARRRRNLGSSTRSSGKSDTADCGDEGSDP